MKTKKSDKANLEKKRILFFQLGLIISASLALIAFEWTTTTGKIVELEGANIKDIEIRDVLATRAKEPELPKPKDLLPKDLEIVDDETEIEDEFDIISTEIDESFSLDSLIIWDPPEEIIKDEIFVDVSEMPKFKGKPYNEFRNYVGERIRFPDLASQNDIDGVVTVNFVVNEEGELEDIKLVRSVHPVLDNEVLKVVRNSPKKWTPGKQRDIPVKVQLEISIRFLIEK